MKYERYTEQMDAATETNRNAIALEVYDALRRLFFDMHGVVYDTDYRVRFTIDEPRLTMQGIITIDVP